MICCSESRALSSKVKCLVSILGEYNRQDPVACFSRGLAIRSVPQPPSSKGIPPPYPSVFPHLFLPTSPSSFPFSAFDSSPKHPTASPLQFWSALGLHIPTMQPHSVQMLMCWFDKISSLNPGTGAALEQHWEGFRQVVPSPQFLIGAPTCCCVPVLHRTCAGRLQWADGFCSGLGRSQGRVLLGYPHDIVSLYSFVGVQMSFYHIIAQFVFLNLFMEILGLCYFLWRVI